ncbi:MAG: hypothetical protein QOE92_461, partial [Chloroflexota bacterium]|nr:hypothetical protein [Chloroflexota bacterium]
MGRADHRISKLRHPVLRSGFAIFGERGGAVAARRAHNPKVVSSNLTRATNAPRRLLTGAALVALLAACGSTTTIDPSGPYASPRVSPPAASVQT